MALITFSPKGRAVHMGVGITALGEFVALGGHCTEDVVAEARVRLGNTALPLGFSFLKLFTALF